MSATEILGNEDYTMLQTLTKSSACLFITNQLTLCSRVLHEILIVIQLVKKFPTFYRIKRFITMFARVSSLQVF